MYGAGFLGQIQNGFVKRLQQYFLRPAARWVAFLLFLVVLPVTVAYGHGAWLNRPNIRFSPTTDAQIAANIAAGNSAIMPGDIVDLIAEFPSIVDGTLSGPNGYFTVYVPNGTQVVGASIVNAAFADIPARNATSAVSGEGMARGWGPQGQKTFDVTANGWNPLLLPAGCNPASPVNYTAATCNSGMAHIYADTGIFYSTRSDTAFYTGDGTNLASLTNGYRINPTNTKPWQTLGGTGDARVHNKWDAVQSNAFGSGGALANGFSALEDTRINTVGRGTVPYKAGSPVAGPQTGNYLDRYGTTGPWNRINYAGSCYGQDGQDGPANGTGSVSPNPVNNTVNSIAVCSAPPGGYALSEANPLPSGPGGANAVRFAVGGIDQGVTYRVKVRLRVLNPTLIKAFNAEAAGGDSTQGVKAGNDNPWRYYVGGPGVVAPGYSGLLGIKKSIVAVNEDPYVAGSTIPPMPTVRYRITYTNTGLSAHTNLILTDVLPAQSTATSNFTVISGPNIIPASPPATGTITFNTIPTFDVGETGVIEFDVTLNASTGATVTNEARATSTERPIAVTSAVSATVGALNANLLAQKTSSLYDPLGEGKFHLPGEVVVYAIKISNLGDPVTGSTMVITDLLPSQLSFSRYAFDAVTTEPIKFLDGAGTSISGMACCAATHIQYSTNNGATFGYLAPANLFDPSITHIRITPAGRMKSGLITPREFTLLLKGMIK